MGEIEWTAAAFALSLLSMLLSSVAWVHGRISRRHQATDDDLHALETRVATFEARLGYAPSADQVHNLDRHIVELGGDVKALKATMEGFSGSLGSIAKMVDRHEDHLLAGSGQR